MGSMKENEMSKQYRIRKAIRPDRDGCQWVVSEVGRSSIWSVQVWTWSRESAEAIKSALVEGRDFGTELYY